MWRAEGLCVYRTQALLASATQWKCCSGSIACHKARRRHGCEAAWINRLARSRPAGNLSSCSALFLKVIPASPCGINQKDLFICNNKTEPVFCLIGWGFMGKSVNLLIAARYAHSGFLETLPLPASPTVAPEDRAQSMSAALRFCYFVIV